MIRTPDVMDTSRDANQTKPNKVWSKIIIQNINTSLNIYNTILLLSYFFLFFWEIITICCYFRSSNSFSPRPPSTSYMERYQFSYKIFSNTILLHIYNLSYKLNRTMFTYNIIIYYIQIHKHQFTFCHIF